MRRRLAFTKHGLAENPHDYIVTPDDEARPMEVVAAYRRKTPAAIMLRVRYFNGEPAPDIAAASVWVLAPDPEDYENPEAD